MLSSPPGSSFIIALTAAVNAGFLRKRPESQSFISSLNGHVAGLRLLLVTGTPA